MDANVPRRRVQRVLAPWALLGSRQSNLLYGSDNASLAHTSVFFGPFEVSEGSSRVGSSGSNDSENEALFVSAGGVVHMPEEVAAMEYQEAVEEEEAATAEKATKPVAVAAEEFEPKSLDMEGMTCPLVDPMTVDVEALSKMGLGEVLTWTRELLRKGRHEIG